MFALKDEANRPGTIIPSYANYRNTQDIKSQFLLLDGVIPSGLGDMVGKAFATYAASNFIKLQLSNSQRDRIQLDLMSQSIPQNGALNHSMLFFACGHDSSGGSFVPSGTGEFRYVWKDVLNEQTFLRINKVMEHYTQQIGGIFIPNPRATVFGGRVQATHPLGGCPMGPDQTSGVVNHLGQVFNPRGGLHENLYVVDAAIIPHSLAATPLLTITALAERIAEKIQS